MLEQEKTVRSPPSQDEGAAGTTCDELTATPIAHPPVLLRERRQRKLGVKLSTGRGRVGGRCFQICYLLNDLVLIKLISPSQLCFALGGNW